MLIPVEVYLEGIGVSQMSLSELLASKDKILALMKNELFACGLNLYQADIWAKNLDKIVWRQKEKHEQAEALLACFDKKTKIFADVLKEPKARLVDLLKLHIKIAEDLAMSDELDGATRLWSGNDGEAGASFFADFLAKADVLGEIDPKEYLDLFEKMMLGIMVRSKGNLHKRVRILGPMEARLSHYDEIILGGFNDGVWPVLPVSDPWMSRPMKKDFGFETPEKQIGVLGMDFANLLQSKKVYMTRAKMCGGTPMVKSRWWMRLETVLNAAILELEQDELRIEDLAVLLEKAEKYDKSVAPAPTPPVAARPRKLSASAVEKLMRDPYGVYAEYILKLKPLDDLEQKADYRDLGNLVHKVLENFGKKYDTQYPDNAAEILKQMVEMEFENCNFALEKQAFWRPKVEKMMDWIAANEAIYRKEIARIYTEVWGRFFIDDVPGGRFEIYAKADRVDRTIDGKINIIDYKTGSARKETEVRKGYAPQLPIEGLIAVEGGFDGIEKADVDSLMYWRLGDKVTDIKNDMADLLQNTKDRITQLVNLYNFESTGYLSRPNPKEAPSYSDYEHLARVKEWSVKSDGEEG